MTYLHKAALATCLAVAAGIANSAGLPLTIEPVDTDSLPDVGDEWLSENPYRAETAGEDVWQKAVDIGASGFNQNCARCHGLGAVSGGLAPDLRYLEASDYGDEWFVERFQQGYTQDGTTRMPAFGEILGQKAGWAIRTYIETRPDDGSLDETSARLLEIRDRLAGDAEIDAAALKEELSAIAAKVQTASGAPVADSVARRASLELQDDPATWKRAAETLTIGLSAAQ